jgi:histidinol-phosphate aminotransferase
MVSAGRLGTLIERAPDSLFVVDEAYIDYASRDQLELFERYPNVAILRTLSKVGFAAIRVGWLVAQAELVTELDKVRLPYNVPTPSQALATLALTELSGEIDSIARVVKRERDAMSQALAEAGKVEVTPSQANFLWLKTRTPAAQVFDALKTRGILVRSFHQRGGRLANQLRVTVGTPAQNAELLKTLHEVA